VLPAAAAAASSLAAVGAALAAAIPDAFAEQAATRAPADSPAGVAVVIPRSAEGTVPAAAGFAASGEQGASPASVAVPASIQADDTDSASIQVANLAGNPFAIQAAVSGATPAWVVQGPASTPALAVPAAVAHLLLVLVAEHSAEHDFQAAVRARCRDSVQACHLPQVSPCQVSPCQVSLLQVSLHQDASRARYSARERWPQDVLRCFDPRAQALDENPLLVAQARIDPH